MTTIDPIIISGLSKVYGQLHAVNDLSFQVKPGRVTGFLGPNGSGKTTTLRMLLGLAQPTAGTATFGNTAYKDLKNPLSTVGAALEASSFHPGRTGLDHLLTYAPLAGVPDSRAQELLGLVGLSDAAKKRVGEYSLGMRQRLALATALLGDPQYLVLDEPANGLDPMGIRWLRDFLKFLAHEGKTVLVSSHILSEVQQSVDDLIIIANGTLRFADSIAELQHRARPRTFISSPSPDKLRAVAATQGWSMSTEQRGFVVDGIRTNEAGAAAFAEGIELHELSDRTESLEDFFFRLTSNPTADGTVDEHSAPAGGHSGIGDLK